MALLTSDTFNRLNNTSLGNTDGVGTLDPVAWIGNPETSDIVSNTAQTGASATLSLAIPGALFSSVVLNYIDTGTPDIEIFLENGSGVSGVRHGILFRYVDINNLWAFLFNDAGTSRLYKRVAGTWTDMSGNLGGAGSGVVYKIKTSGSKIECTINGVVVFTVYDVDLINATKHGFVNGPGSVQDIEMWEGGLGIPEILQIGPTEGLVSGGTEITIAGHNFTGVTDVKFNSTPAASFVVNSDGYIKAFSPAHASGVVDIVITNAYGDSVVSSADEFTFLEAAPVVSSVTPDNGDPAGGNEVIITGAYFTDVTDVAFGAIPATSFVIDNDGQITAVAPAHASGYVPVIVTSPWGSNV